jgi:signal transduction histidine kinase
MHALFPLDTNSDSPAASSAESRRHSLLIVDDEEGPRQSLRIVFKDDYELYLAEDGYQAIELIKRNRIDAAILDIRLDGMSGIELLERLRTHDPAVEVVMLTAYETSESARQALRLGACDYLNKPFDIATIREAVDKAIRRRSFNEEIQESQQRLELLKSEIRRQQMELASAQTRLEVYASVLHDINSPIAAISGISYLMVNGLSQTQPLNNPILEKIKEELIEVQRLAEACVNISSRYLSFLRRRPDENSVVCLDSILSDLPQLLKSCIGKSQVQLIIQPLVSEVRLKMNGTDLTQVLVNLVTNSCNCSPLTRTIKISVEQIIPPLNLNQFNDSPETRFIVGEGFSNSLPLLALSVKDDGPGISPEVMSRVFDPFFSTRPNGRNSGLGLAIVRRLICESKGAIHLSTKLGSETTFTLFLPMA